MFAGFSIKHKIQSLSATAAWLEKQNRLKPIGLYFLSNHSVRKWILGPYRHRRTLLLQGCACCGWVLPLIPELSGVIGHSHYDYSQL